LADCVVVNVIDPTELTPPVVLWVSMKKNQVIVLLIGAACLSVSAARAEIAAQPVQPVQSATEQIRAERAKAAREDAAESTVRPWDRNSNGKRPWEIKQDPIK
jgi:sRNA-binding protein